MSCKVKIYLIIGILNVFLILSCSDITKYSEIPQIQYLNHVAYDTVDILSNPIRFVELQFSIIDGDGDFGLKDSDTLHPYDTIYDKNFFSTIYGLSNNNYIEIDDIFYPDSRIKYVEVENHKAYKADIYIEFEYPKSMVEFDTIKYDFYVVDRALNHSNLETTPDIIFND